MHGDRLVLAKVLNSLTYREREVIKLRYGIGDGYTYTLKEVGKIFRVTRERIRMVEARAIHKLQHSVCADRLYAMLGGGEPTRDDPLIDDGLETTDEVVGRVWFTKPYIRRDGRSRLKRRIIT